MRRYALAAAVLVALSACAVPDASKPYKDLAAKTAESRKTFEPIPVLPADAYRIFVQSGAQQVEVLHDESGVWNAGEGATDESAGLVTEAEAILFPTLAYRKVPGSMTDPQFGFPSDPMKLIVETRTATRYEVTFGGPSLNGGGFYVSVAGDPSLYLVIPQVYYDLKSIAAGVKIERPVDPVMQAAIAAVDATDDPEEVKNPWLGQVVGYGL